MALHPEQRKRYFPEEAPVAWDPIRRDLEENEDWYRDLVEHSQDLLCVHDLEGRFLSVNPVPARLLGYSVEEILRKPMRDFVDPQFRAQFDAYLREIERTGESRGLLAVITRSGEQRIWEYHNTLRTEGVETPIVRGIAHDVTERVRAEKALRASNEQLMKTAREREQTLLELTLFRTLLDQSNDAILVSDPETLRFLDSNERAWAELGYSREELLSMTVFDIDPDIESLRTRLDQQLRQTGCAIIERAHRRKDGTTFPVELNLRRVRLDREYDVAVSRDITARKRAEEALRETNERLRKTAREREQILHDLTLFRTLLDQSNDAIQVMDPETQRFLDVNERTCADLGYSREELLSMTVFDIDPDADESLCATVQRQLRESGCAIFERAHRRKDGTTLSVEVNLRRVRLDRAYDVAVSRDITARKQAEERLREFERVVESLEEMIVVVNREYRYVLANRAFLSRRGMTKEQAVGRSIAEVLNPGVFETVVREKLDECFRGKVVNYELKYKYPEMGERDLSLTYLPVEGPTGIDHAACVMRDITERKRAEEALRESELRFRAVFERSPVGISLVDSRSGEYLQVNPKFCEIAGRSEEELLRSDVESITHPDDIAQGSDYRRQLAEEKLTGFEMDKRYVRPDGSVRWVRVLVVPMWGKGETHRLNMALVEDITEQKQADEALRESERRQQLALQIGKIGAFELDLEGGRGTWTAEFAEIWGIPSGFAGNFATFFSWELVHPEDRARVKEEFAELAQSREEGESEFRVIRPDGVVRWIRGRGLVVADTAAGSLRVVGVILDITEQKQAEDALRRGEENYRMFVAQSSEGIFRQDLDAPIPVDLPEDDLVHHILYDSYLAECNDAIVKMYGLNSMQEFVGKRLTETLDPNDPHNIQLTRDFIRSGFRVLERESHEVDAHGSPKVFLNSMIGIVEDGNLVRTWGIQRDVTEKVKLEDDRKQAEEALRQSEERFRVALKHSPIAVYNLDRDLRYTWMYNPQVPRPVSEQLGKTAHEIFDPEEAARITEVRRRVLETGGGVRHEIQATFGGRKQYLDATIEPVLDSTGAVIGLTGASMDVTELRETTEALREAKKKLTEEKLYLEQEINTELGFGEIIAARGSALEAVMENVRKVAVSDATVLLLGETGTGKELVARAVHWLSLRTGNSFIKLNCAAIPSGLLESELFGNEKGAFTGAVSKKIGRLELADKGTLFLDEIGEISMALQPKLLRVLQDQEFERLGGTHTLKVDFRLIAATNRDLADAVLHNEFRSDLYYRLNVFPIRVPPLRERREDIPLLVEYFVQKFARRMSKSITSIPKKTMDMLMGLEWPGNVRELENFIERSVILTQGSVLVPPLGEMVPISTTAEKKRVDETLEATEREHILRALRQSHGQIGGLKGAAMRLGLKRTTLQSKLKHLGINPRSGFPDQ
ncbi:MAG TPA: PAS domain S-box protein [Terriglobales bacterium]|nr:PAS domain S-box protein [Terriglobales bacterium]